MKSLFKKPIRIRKLSLSMRVFLFMCVPLAAASLIYIHNARAAQLYYNNFDAQTAGATPTGFIAISPAVFQVGTSSPITGKQAILDTNTADAHIGLLTSITAQTSMAAQISEIIHMPDLSNVSSYSLILQSDVTAQNYYMVFLALASNQIQLYKRVGGGSLTLIGSSTYPFSDNEHITLKGDVNNGVVNIKVWSPGGYELTASTTIITDPSPLSNAGYAGIRKTVSGSPIMPSVDDFFMGDSGTTFAQINVNSETLAWQNRVNVFTFSGVPGTFDQYQVLEPTRPIWDGTQWVMFYTGCDHVNSAIGRATSSDLINWSRYSSNPILGRGFGGESLDASQSAAILRNGVWYIYYSTSYDTTSDGKVATSSDGIHFANPQIFIARSSQSWFSGISNKGVLIDDDGVWKMLFEARGTVSGNPWELGLATSSDGYTWRLGQNNPLTSLRIANGSFSGARTFTKINGVYNIWYHTSYGTTLPSDISHAVSKDLKYWTVISGNPIFYREGETFPSQNQIADQVADPSIIESGGNSYLFYDVDSNINPLNISARIDRATYNGPLSDLAGSINPDLTLGIAGLWTMDNADISGSTVTDTSPNANNATLVGSPTTGALGEIGQAVTLNGSSQYATITSVAPLNHGTGQFSVSAWFKKSANGVYGGLVSKIDALDVAGYSLNMNGDNTVSFYTINNVTHDQIYSSAITDTNWHLAVGVRDGLNVRLYIDGVLVGSVTDRLLNVNNGNPVAIGLYRSADTTHNRFAGSIDDVRIYDHGIDQSVVSQLYSYGYTPTVTTSAASSVTATTSTLAGSVSVSLASSSVRGFVYSTSSTLASGISTTTESGTFGTGSFSATVSGLNASTAYYFEAYASNASSTAYGSIQTFTTSSAATPTVTVTSGQATSSIAQTTVTFNATTTGTGGATITARGFNYGTTLSYGSSASTTGSFGTGSYSQAVTGLTCNTTYHFQATVANSAGTGTSSDQTFTTSACSANTYTFSGPSSGTANSASTNFTVTPNAAYTGTITLTPTGTASTGLTARVLTFSNSSVAQTFTITPTVSGSITLTPTNNGSLTNPANLTYTVTALDSTAPVSSSISATPAGTSAALSWTTDELASSKAIYGPTSAYGSTTSMTDTSPRVLSHSLSLTNLISCSTYHYAVVSLDSLLNSGTSTDQTFTTSGCVGSGSPVSASSTSILVSAGGTSSLAQSGSTMTVTAPANITSTSSSVVIQIQALTASAVLDVLGTPAALTGRAGSVVFDIKAVVDSATILDSFNAPVTISYHYSDSDIANVSESSLWIYHYHNGAWSALDSCAIDAAANTITCTTTSFSIFALFGQTVSAPSGSSGNSANATANTISSTQSSSVIYGCKDPKATNYNYFSSSKPSLCVYAGGAKNTSPIASVTPAGATSMVKFAFVRDLEVGSKGNDVKLLQQFLNISGFIIAKSGAGSPGKETDTFGAYTKKALAAFQKANKISPAYGNLGPLTRAFINAQIK